MATLKGTPAQGLFGATLGFFIGFAAVALFGPTAQRFQQAMNLSPVAVGFLIAMPALSGSLLRIPFSAWVDISGGRKPFLTLLSLRSASHEPESRGGGFPHRHAGPFRVATAHPVLGLGRHQRRTKAFPDAAQPPICKP